jgi:hypothetical protein
MGAPIGGSFPCKFYATFTTLIECDSLILIRKSGLALITLERLGGISRGGWY